MKRFYSVLILLLLFPLLALSESLGFTVAPEMIRPGKAERISISVPADGDADLVLLDENGGAAASIWQDYPVVQGVNHLTWNGMNEEGKAVSEGRYILQLRMGGETADHPIAIGKESPQLLSVKSSEAMEDGEKWVLTVNANMAGTLMVRLKLDDGEWHTVIQQAIPQGETTLTWDGTTDTGDMLPYGRYTIQVRLFDEEGYGSTARQSTLAKVAFVTPVPVPTATPKPAPKTVIPSQARDQADETNYWTLPMGELDEKAIWDVMMQPMTVIDGNEKEVYQLRKTPNNTKSNNVVGEITYASQGVHVLETLDNGWTLVEAYNSSYGPNCASRRGFGVTDDLIQGYVKTSLLITVKPDPTYGLLVDKDNQTMYIFSDGRIIGTLLVSTGLNNSKQSWNETPSGEFVIISPKMGGFAAGNLWCAYGMRVNGGCAIHQVPYIGDENTPPSRQDFSTTVPKLGSKASHGCIRVQKTPNENGQNMEWLWRNVKKFTKVLIWDDTGRFIHYPDDSTSVYYNPDGGKYYHEDQNCRSVKSRYLPLKAFPYADMEVEPFASLQPCPSCVQKILRESVIDSINRENGF